MTPAPNRERFDRKNLSEGQKACLTEAGFRSPHPASAHEKTRRGSAAPPGLS